MAMTALASEAFLILGIILGWFAAEKFREFVDKTRHTYEELFDENPHPEIFDKDGKVNRGEYYALTFEPGYDPEDFDPEDIFEM